MINSYNHPFSPRKKGPGRRGWRTLRELEEARRRKEDPHLGQPGKRLMKPSSKDF